MTDEQKASVEATAAERAGYVSPPVKVLTLEDLNQRVIALENHPALAPKEEETNG